ncbi:hypothetical protein BGW80DRAFT_1488042 [Lactifluus volemus]|nr:hypothetical protein BGW80DRAFT_1488036 [Lactifluus volemus]KAH9975014.1 hypothetical protein BGW80DRAFT_1488042 [Lactifluus volemus]
MQPWARASGPNRSRLHRPTRIIYSLHIYSIGSSPTCVHYGLRILNHPPYKLFWRCRLLLDCSRRTRVQAGLQAAVSKASDAVADRTENYISSRRLLLSLADAGGRLMYAYKDVLELAGLTTRIYSLLSALHNLPSLPTASPVDSVNPRISLDNVDLSIPASGARDAPLVKALSLSLCEGEHLMITCSNGVGKTAVARVLAGLWAPGNEAYMVTGSLLEQIIYPHTYPQFVQSGRTKEDLMETLEAVHLAYLPTLSRCSILNADN